MDAESRAERLQDPELSGSTVLAYQQMPGTSPNCFSLQLIVGTDRFSSGMTAYVNRPSRGRYAYRQCIVRSRWMLMPGSPEECVRAAILGLQAWLVKEGHAPQ